MSRSSERDPDGVAGALAMHLCFYCAVAACFALALYYLMQPTRLPNPGMAAYKPPLGALAAQTVSLRFGTEPIKAAEPEPETTGAAPALAAKPEAKEGKKVKAGASQGRPRSAQRRQPVETRSYGAEPSFGYRPMY
jgi:hypothetical protein